MQLIAIKILTGKIKLLSGLHIGGSDGDMHIGGIDDSVIKNPVTNEPYIPGSSIKGKMRSLLEWELGVVGQTDGRPLGYKDIDGLDEDKKQRGKDILKLFGGAPEMQEKLAKEIGPTRLAFWDCSLDPDWTKKMGDRNLLLTEVKTENSIDRIRGVAEYPRQMERVPAGARFQFRLTIREHADDGDLLDTVCKGLKLIEISGLGGSGSRGYGKIEFKDLKCGDKPLDERMKTIEPFGSTA